MKWAWLVAVATFAAAIHAQSPSVAYFDTIFRGERDVRRTIAGLISARAATEFHGLEDQALEHLVTQINPHRPAVLVHSFANERDGQILKELKNRLDVTPKVIHFGSGPADLSFVDLHLYPDHYPRAGARADSVLVPALPSRIVARDLNAIEIQDQFKALPGRRILVLVGGQTAGVTFTFAMADALVRQLELVSRGHTLIISTSRRTPHHLRQTLRRQFANAIIIEPDRDVDPPSYDQLLRAAEVIVVTADSSLMTVDAVGTGKPVYLFAPKDLMEERHLRLSLYLLRTGRVRVLYARLNHFGYEPLTANAVITRTCVNFLARQE